MKRMIVCFTFFLLFGMILICIGFYEQFRYSQIVTISENPNLLGAKTTIALPSLPHPCQSVDGFPDKICTPGAVDPNVSQDNIHQTICVKGYTKTVRPNVSYTNKLKRKQIIEYGYTDLNPSHYEEDHLIALELGGSPDDPRNLWPEPEASPNDKDVIENRCNRKVCSGELFLTTAQQQIATNWKTACQY